MDRETVRNVLDWYKRSHPKEISEPKYINANELRAMMYHEAFEEDSDLQRWDGGCWIRYKMFENAIEQIGAADIVEVVRCKDCKHWDKTWTNDWSPDYHYCPIIDGVRKGDFYCADAERKTDERSD